MIKPCPFCGHQPDLSDPDTLYTNGIGWLDLAEHGCRSYHSFREVPADQWCWNFVCDELSGGCGATLSGDSKEEVIEKWDRRVV